MSKLPKHLQEAQELFRARMDEHKRRIDALFEDEEYLVPSERLLAEIRSSKSWRQQRLRSSSRGSVQSSRSKMPKP
jgi:hypothetical protein